CCGLLVAFKLNGSWPVELPVASEPPSSITVPPGQVAVATPVTSPPIEPGPAGWSTLTALTTCVWIDVSARQSAYAVVTMPAPPCPPEFPTALQACGSVAPVSAGLPEASLAKLPIGFTLAVGKFVNAPPPTSRVLPGQTAVASAVEAFACGPGVDVATTW